MRTLSLKLLLLLFASMLGAQQPRRDMVPMRDGVRLSTHVTVPSGSGKFPAILMRSPNKIQTGRNRYLDAGYAVVQQNLRGQFESEGTWGGFIGEMNDGFDTVEWIAAQPWSNGKVGVLGGSTSGVAGYMTLMSGAPHLSCGVIQNAHASPYSVANYPGGVYQAAFAENWMSILGAKVPPPFPRPIIRKLESDLMNADIQNRAASVKVPILHQTGWFDIFTQGAIDFFVSAQTNGSERAPGNQKLIIHPRGHGEKLAGPLQWPGEIADIDNYPKRWFDYWMRDIDTAIQKIPAVQYYSLGDPSAGDSVGNSWRTSGVWPPPSVPASYYLQSGGGLSITPPPHASGSGSFDYDPQDPVPSIPQRPGDWLTRAPTDQRPLKDRADILRFASLPLSAAVEIAGSLRAELFVSTTARDTDFFVRLIDIHPNGYEALLAAQPMRLRFREGFERMAQAQKNRVYRLDVNLWPLAAVFEKGHRIGVQITSSDSPRFDRNTNTWEPVKSYKDSVRATNTVHYSSLNASRIILPVVQRKVVSQR